MTNFSFQTRFSSTITLNLLKTENKNQFLVNFISTKFISKLFNNATYPPCWLHRFACFAGMLASSFAVKVVRVSLALQIAFSSWKWKRCLQLVFHFFNFPIQSAHVCLCVYVCMSFFARLIILISCFVFVSCSYSSCYCWWRFVFYKWKSIFFSRENYFLASFLLAEFAELAIYEL